MTKEKPDEGGTYMLHEEPKFSLRINPDCNEKQLLFAKQLGVEYVYTWVREEQRNRRFLKELVDRVGSAGLTLYNVGNPDVGKAASVHLGLADRDERIAQFQEFVRDLEEAGVRTTTFTWEPDRVWSSTPTTVRNAGARYVNLRELEAHPFTHGREYRRDELWENFSYFCERLVPVAEEHEVRLALHPNDPPAESLGGVPCLIRSHADYRRAFNIAQSPWLGMEFCTGCWLEGGSEFGDIEGALREFSFAGRIFIVHFRNVSSPLPVFNETFLDNGYQDMYSLMKILHDTDYAGTVTFDHTPKFFENEEYPYAESAYAIAYMRALSERAVAE